MMFSNNVMKSFQSINEMRYHNIHKKTALKAVKDIKKISNYTLTPEQKNECNEYAYEILGSKKYAPWLYVYTAFNQEFKEGWIPDNYFGAVVYPNINNGLGHLSDIKTLTNKLIDTELLPDKAYKVNNIFYDRNYSSIPIDNLKKYLFDQNNELYVKLDDSNQGRGVFLIEKDTFNINKLHKLNNLVIQTPIYQNDWFKNIVDSGGATIRVTTVRTPDNKIETRAATLRVGIESSKVIKHYNSIRIPIKIQDGSLNLFGADSYWQKYYKHPVSGYVFNGKKIPAFNKSIKILEELHEKFIHYSVIGWDISINQNEFPEIIEWNADHPGIKFHEAYSGPNFNNLDWENIWKE